jgi:hypothetical protein
MPSSVFSLVILSNGSKILRLLAADGVSPGDHAGGSGNANGPPSSTSSTCMHSYRTGGN